MAFRKVRATSGPAHVFFVADETLARWPDKYTPVDRTAYAKPGATVLAAPSTTGDKKTTADKQPVADAPTGAKK